MSSMSGDESEHLENEPGQPVRRTRSGRTVKTPSAKKTPKKPATRATRRIQPIEDIEEEAVVELTGEAPENGMQQTDIPASEEGEEGLSLHVQLEGSMDSTEQQIEFIAEMENQSSSMDSCSQQMSFKVRETMQLMPDSEDTSDPMVVFDAGETNLESANQTNANNAGQQEDDQFENLCAEEQQDQIDQEFIPREELSEEEVILVPNEQSQSLEMDVGELDESEQAAGAIENLKTAQEHEDMESGAEQLEKTEPDTEAVSEDELPNETAAKEPETEAVSDEELPVAAAADLGETESVSEDELPPDSDKKRKVLKSTSKTSEMKVKANGGSKRKLNAAGEYDPSSPTSENNDEIPAKKMAVSSGDNVDDSKLDVKPDSPKKKTLPELDKYWKAVNEDPSDFTGWTYLLQYVDQENDAEAAREAYSKFLERYPYCYGYWRKYADYEMKKGDPGNVQMVFDQGLKAISLSVDLWLHYINHCKVIYEKDEEKMREQYERAIKACGLEFKSDQLWKSYIKWETEGKRFNRVLSLYDRLLSTPTFNHTMHFEAFQEFVQSNAPNRVLTVDDFLALRSEVKVLLKANENVTSAQDDVPPGEELPPHEMPPTDEETRAIREKIISSRRKMHKANVNAVAARWSYEEGIKRPYFHVKPLERCQLKNWKEYLDFEIEQKDQNRIIILFERCLIACALYDEFWMRFIRYLESLKVDFSKKIRDVYTRACTIHHPKKPNLHLQWATFEESQGNFEQAATILENIDNLLPNMLQIAYRRINVERRRMDLEKACTLYENYISNSKNRTIANNIAVKYARFLCKIKNDVDKAVKVLLKATEKDKDNPRLYLQLIDLGLQRSPVDTQEIIGYMDMFIDREHADLEQRVLFAQRKVEFLEDFSPDIRQILKAHEQFQKCIKQAKERKKAKNDDTKVDVTPPKKAKTSDQSNAPPPPSMSSQSSYQYGSGPGGPYQSQQQFQSGQYGSQGSYQQGYQQYPPPSDPNYANYQNWQYGQGGPQAYGPYNQWGSYNYY